MSSYQIYTLAGDPAILGRLQAEQVRERPHPIRAPRAPWAADLDSWDPCDQCCTNLWVRTPFAREQALVWREREAEFVKRAGFVLMVRVAGKDKGAPAALLHRYLARAEQGAADA